MNLKFYLRWSGRDARERWLQVVSIALIIALGTGVFSAFGNQKDWRISSMDRSYALLHMFDLRIELTEGSFIDQAELETALRAVEGVAQVDTRLITPTLLDASKNGETILYPGKIIGMDVSGAGVQINQLNMSTGQAFTAEDSGSNVIVIDYLFSKYRGLEAGDQAQIAGGTAVQIIGRGQTPENFAIVPGAGAGGLAENENTFAVMYMPLASLQRISGRQAQVNDILLMLNENADIATVEAGITAVTNEQFGDVGITFIRKADDPATSVMYADARGDQRLWNIIGGLFLIGAAMATFNLAGRIVEAQRRQIGIGMALGVHPLWLAFRPILLGLQIAILGTIFGLILGYGLTSLLADIMKDFYPLPYWGNPFSWESFARATVLSIIVPVLATLYPVWRAVRVNPVDAIQTGYLVAKGGGLAPLMERVPIPGKSFTQIPFRNLLRSPWRTFLTILGVAIAILLLIATAGLLDTIQSTIDEAGEFYLKQHPERIDVVMDTVYPIAPDTVDPSMAAFVDVDRLETLRQLKAADGSPLFEKVDTGLLMIGELISGGERLDVLIEMYAPATVTWTPAVHEGSLPNDEPGIMISEKAADDLHLHVGDTVILSHPQREGFNYRMVETAIPVIGIHDNPYRPQTYMSLHQADLIGVPGFANQLTVYPGEGVTPEEVRRALFEQPGVASIQVIEEIPGGFEEAMEIFAAVLLVTEIVVLVMAFLIAFNSTSINVDERAREIATMFAFGLPIRIVTRMQMVENFITGLLGTLLGTFLGYLALRWIVTGQLADMVPDIRFSIVLAPPTLAAAMMVGIVVVALTPLFTIRRMWTMDIPSTLRVME